MGKVKPERGQSEFKGARCKSMGGGTIPKGANVVRNIVRNIVYRNSLVFRSNETSKGLGKLQ